MRTLIACVFSHVFSLEMVLFADGARTKLSLLYFFFKCEFLTEAASAVLHFFYQESVRALLCMMSRPVFVVS